MSHLQLAYDSEVRKQHPRHVADGAKCCKQCKPPGVVQISKYWRIPWGTPSDPFTMIPLEIGIFPQQHLDGQSGQARSGASSERTSNEAGAKAGQLLLNLVNNKEDGQRHQKRLDELVFVG